MFQLATSKWVKWGIALILSVCFRVAKAQDSSRIFFTSSAGFVVPQSTFARAYQNSLAFNSGIEYRLKKHYFIQFVLDFNAVKYNQQIKDKNSNFLFQNTNSSLLLAGLSVGKDFSLTHSGRLTVSPYVGAGYANIGEPRLTVNNATGIIYQNVTRMKGAFARTGLRLLYDTRSKIFQRLYFDVSYWTSNVQVQESKAQALAFLVGTRIGF